MSEEKAYPEDDCHYLHSTIAINLVNYSKFSHGSGRQAIFPFAK